MAGPVHSAKAKCPEGWCPIPGGKFKMGSPVGVREKDEHPQRQITLSAYEIQKTEVTVGAYRKFLGAAQSSEQKPKFVLSGCSRLFSTKKEVEAKEGETWDQLRRRATQLVVMKTCNAMNPVQQPSSDQEVLNLSQNKQGDNYPIVRLTYQEQQAYCQSLGRGSALPTEAQLECASKGKSGTDKYGTPFDKAILWENGARSAAPVCGANDERANSFGICDLAGNVWETALDTYDERFYSRMPDKDPVNPLTDKSQVVVLRGASWQHGETVARAANRGGGTLGYRSSHVGFRCARPQDSKK